MSHHVTSHYPYPVHALLTQSSVCVCVYVNLLRVVLVDVCVQVGITVLYSGYRKQNKLRKLGHKWSKWMPELVKYGVSNQTLTLTLTLTHTVLLQPHSFCICCVAFHSVVLFTFVSLSRVFSCG